MAGYGQKGAGRGSAGSRGPARGGGNGESSKRGDTSMPEYVKPYPGVPGPTQTRDRSLGFPRTKHCPQKQGL